METLIIIVIACIAGIAAAKLIPYIKDFKVTSEEKAKVQEILIDAAKNILEVANSKDKEQLILAITNIAYRELENENIKGFTRKDIELMARIVVDKLEDLFKARNL
ncbi:hypothetical protein SAMN02745135_00993 [Caloranaerobacter azorensis DSM 13643]|uniref:Bacteriophage holin of superfamily 6 (Holin_LLH) n=1 Tax=Caloranaerobacter azorensis DSM 13643 TaxID=1121264 RepID=A0A1M5TGI4_9FIRM|nr:hypothetical protein [Caloranaerobacter azorensis]SHH49824.1 hypothetical protein SAMN02745135_00993 [Caloranaerobacter azorensis DSM 13643]